MTADIGDRTTRRHQQLRTALAGMPSADFSDDRAVAIRCTTPGFGLLPDKGDSAAPGLVDNRERRTLALEATLSGAASAIRRDPDALAAWLLESRHVLVHPTTGESLSLLDWINRGGGPVEV